MRKKRRLYNGLVTSATMALSFLRNPSSQEWRDKLMWAKVYLGIDQVVSADGMYWYVRGAESDDWLGLLWHEREIVGRISSLFREGETFLDIGANVGGYSIRAAKHGMKVIAFEPNPDAASVLRENIRLNFPSTNTQVEVRQVALGLKDETAFLILRGGRSEMADEGERVEVRRLDSYSFDNISLIKIDVEGHEEAVLRGAERTLTKHRPRLVVEVHGEMGSARAESCKDLLETLGYRTSWITTRNSLYLSASLGDPAPSRPVH